MPTMPSDFLLIFQRHLKRLLISRVQVDRQIIDWYRPDNFTGFTTDKSKSTCYKKQIMKDYFYIHIFFDSLVGKGINAVAHNFDLIYFIISIYEIPY